jgi:ketosteroid isomerase-like protein
MELAVGLVTSSPPPTGGRHGTAAEQTTRTSWVLTFEGDKITNSRHYFDMLSMMQQLGVIPR